MVIFHIFANRSQLHGCWKITNGDVFLTRETSIIEPTNLLEKNLVHLLDTAFNAFLVGMFTCIYTYTNFIILMIWSPSVAKFFENKTRKFSKNSSQGEYSKKSMEESLEKFLQKHRHKVTKRHCHRICKWMCFRWGTKFFTTFTFMIYGLIEVFYSSKFLRFFIKIYLIDSRFLSFVGLDQLLSVVITNIHALKNIR